MLLAKRQYTSILIEQWEQKTVPKAAGTLVACKKGAGVPWAISTRLVLRNPGRFLICESNPG